MVYSTINPAPQTYLLWHRFSMPSSTGTYDAIAVKASVAHELNSAYTFLLDHLVLLVWSLTVISGLLMYLRVHRARHPHDPLSKALWAKRTSPFSILKLTLKHLWKSTNREWWILLWVFLALGFLVLKYAIPIVFAPYIIIDNAAPVAAQAIYIPSYNSVALFNDPIKLLEIFALELPAALRAVGNIDSVNSTIFPTSLITIDQPEILTPNSSTNDPNQRINYRYVVTGQDFGLQKYPDLTLNVEGSCITEYSWFGGSGVSQTDHTITEDYYYLDNNPNSLQWVSYADSPAPVAQFFLNVTQSSGPASNLTWAAIVSSVDRESYYSSNDPWYFTVPTGVNVSSHAAPFKVKQGRPALSCWQDDVWSYQGSSNSVLNLTSTNIPGLELPLALQDIFAHYLGEPKVPTLGLQLGLSALQSASTAFDSVFNASSSSLFDDLQRLVFASYIATVNTLTETTLYSTDTILPNDILVQGQIPVGVDEFVIWSKDVITLSVKALIIIPVLTVALWIIFIVVLLLPLKPIQALKELTGHGHSSAHEVPADGNLAHSTAVKENEEEGEDKEKESPISKVVSKAVSVCGSINSNANPGDDGNEFV
ncbi:hypothetical protein MMC17_007379 [Xylographa soralifera]|nr:hypothetical protein [Xylographa soralifera]